MFKAMIVDDDMLVRMDLRVLIDWNQFDVELMEDAADGEEAIEKIQLLNPDILILDIGMPKKNGLEVILTLREWNFKGKIIVLSCHDDFEIVKEALKKGAADYILKDVLTPSMLADSVSKVIDDLKKDMKEIDELTKIRQISEMSMTITRDELVKELMSGSIKDKSTLNLMLEQNNIRTEPMKFIVVLIDVDDLYLLKERYGERETETLMKSFRRMMEETLADGEASICGSTGEGRLCALVGFEQTENYRNVNNKIYEICEKILENSSKYLCINISIGISKVCEDLSGLELFYTQAEKALMGKSFLGKNKIIHILEVEHYNENIDGFIKHYENEIYETITTTGSKISVLVKNIFSVLRSKNIAFEYFRILKFELLDLLNKILRKYNISNNAIFMTDYLPYDHIMNLETIDEIEEWFCGACLRINDEINNQINGEIKGNSMFECRNEIKKALDYIENYYMKEISLQEISDNSNLSKTYFSQLFKQEIGKGFVEYLGEYRIEKARRMIENTDLKIYKISWDCGFNNYRYFAKLFKKITGKSPLEYKKLSNS